LLAYCTDWWNESVWTVLVIQEEPMEGPLAPKSTTRLNISLRLVAYCAWVKWERLWAMDVGSEEESSGSGRRVFREPMEGPSG